jgi:hypothetical protein
MVYNETFSFLFSGNVAKNTYKKFAHLSVLCISGLTCFFLKSSLKSIISFILVALPLNAHVWRGLVWVRINKVDG